MTTAPLDTTAGTTPRPHSSGLPVITHPPVTRPQPKPTAPPIPEPTITTTTTTEPTTTDTPADTTPAAHGYSRVQKLLIAIVVLGVIAIAGIGFTGSYSAVTAQAEAKGFGWFGHWITIGVDSGIAVFLALDLLLTWLRMPYPLLRPGAWFLTGATIVFNASASWPDPIGVGMHATIPILFVLAVEAARHSIARAADLAVQQYTETPPVKRWILAPLPTFRLWRRQTLWQLRSYTEVLDVEKERIEFRLMLRSKYGRSWKRNAHPADVLALRFARHGMPIATALQRAETELAAITERAARRNATAPRNDETPHRETTPTATRNGETATGATPATGGATASGTRNATPAPAPVAASETTPEQRETARATRNATTPASRNATPRATGNAVATPISREDQLAIVGRFVEEWNGPDKDLPLQPIADALGRSKPTASRLVAAYRNAQSA